MTSTPDLDRLLGEWLDDGPRRAPDRPMQLAVEHARRHHRRPDPFGFLRSDVMAPRRSAFGLRPVLVLAALALLLAAAVVIGGGAFRPAVQIPVPAVSPSSTPSVVLSPTGPPVAGIIVDLEVTAGQPQTVDVVDGSGLLVAASSGRPNADGGQSFPVDSVDVTNLDDTTLQLGWAGFPCATDHGFAIDETARTMVLTRPECVGETDAIGVDRILILEFSEPIDAADVTVTIER
jgi:hypothetical protein